MATIICDTLLPIDFEGQSNAEWALQSWRFALDQPYYHDIDRVLINRRRRMRIGCLQQLTRYGNTMKGAIGFLQGTSAEMG